MLWFRRAAYEPSRNDQRHESLNRDHAETPSGELTRNRIANTLATVGVFVFAFAASPFPHLAELALVLILIGLIISPNRHLRWRDPLVISMVVLGFYLVVAIYIGWRLFPDLLSHHLTDAFYIFLLPFMILIVAWALKGDQQRMMLVLKAALGGLVFAIVAPLLFGSVSIEEFLQGQRNGMMFSNPLRLGLYSAAALLALFIFGFGQPRFRATSIAYFIGYVFLCLLLVQALIVSQSRSAWVFGAMTFSVIALVLFVQVMSRPHRGGVLVSTIFLVMLVASSMALLLHWNAPLFSERWASVEGLTSAGIRYRMWEIGIEQIAERPLTGHGPGSARFFLQQGHQGIQEWSPLPVPVYSHLHNMYIQFLVTIGAIGLLLVMAVFLVLFAATAQAVRMGLMEKRMALFVIGALALFVLDNLTGYTLSRGQGRFFIALTGGMAYTIWFWKATEPGARLGHGWGEEHMKENKNRAE